MLQLVYTVFYLSNDNSGSDNDIKLKSYRRALSHQFFGRVFSPEIKGLSKIEIAEASTRR